MIGDSIGFEEISVDAGVASLNSAIYDPAVGDAAAKAFITAEGGAMRYRLDGQDPTDTDKYRRHKRRPSYAFNMV